MWYRALLVAGALVAGAVQFVDDAALGDGAGTLSLPRALARAVGPGPAHALGFVQPRDAHDALAERNEIDRIDAQGDYARARSLATALVARLRRERANREVLADALWRLGQLDAEAGYREPPHRRIEWRKALRDYQDALDLVPLSERTLLAAAYQAALIGEYDLAATYFRRAIASDPSSVEAREGLQRLEKRDIPPPFVAPAEWKARR
jgi:tetratricopeptide (TPR) repeat protein